MIPPEQAESLRAELLGLLAEDAHNAHRLADHLDRLSRERGASAHAALLLLLTRLAFDEAEARRHWAGIRERQRELQQALGRDAGVRVAVLDYFVHVNRHLVQPRLIDLEMTDAAELDALRDAKTGLVADRPFRTALQQELRRTRRYGDKASVVLFDIDGFAAVNARVGPILGDRLLREAALLLSNHIRDIDVAARPGEDELAVLLPETDRNGALLVGERFRREVETFFAARDTAGEPAGLTVSGGIATYPEDAATPDALLVCAAQALYQAKALGKNLVHAYVPERRRFLRFELAPGRFEIEVLGSAGSTTGRPRDLSGSGILFLAPEPIDVGARIEIRLADGEFEGRVCVRGTVVRVEELPAAIPVAGAALPDRFEIGLELDGPGGAALPDVIGFLERARRGPGRV